MALIRFKHPFIIVNFDKSNITSSASSSSRLLGIMCQTALQNEASKMALYELWYGGNLVTVSLSFQILYFGSILQR